jgi:alpha-L-rhamnosidase/Glycosyl hydrolases family 2, sugar binding domain
MNPNRRIFLRNTAIIGGAITLRSVAGEAAQASLGAGSLIADPEHESAAGGSVRQLFQSTPKKYRPLVRWWWPGNDVTEPELRREVEVLDQAGFGGAEIQAFIRGFPANKVPEVQMARMNSFATPSFFRNVAAAAKEARNRGMFIDYTFGSGWPFGGGEAITPELASIELRSTHLSVRGPAQLSQKLQMPSVTDGDLTSGSEKLAGLPPGWAERMRKRTRLVAVVAVRGEDAQWDFPQGEWPRRRVTKPGQLQRGTSIDLTARLQSDGTLSWDVPEGTWQVFVFCSVPTAQRVSSGAGSGPQLVMDHLSVAAFQAHARRVGDASVPYLGEFFGNGLRAVFCDSLEVSANLFWSDDFLAEFRRRRGYDLLPYLPLLKVQDYAEPFSDFIDIPLFDMDEIGSQARFDYHQTISDLMRERFYDQFNQWAHDHKLLSRTQAHGAPTEALQIYGEADIPETEQLFNWDCYDFLKVAASAANVNGRSIVGSESFVWPTAAYQATPEKVKVAADELLTAGVNAIVYHGFPYIVPGLQPPGWHPFNGINGDGNWSSQFNELNPFWPYLAQINAYITRLQFISQMGTNVAAVALYRNDVAHSTNETPPSPRLTQALLNAGYNYDHINAASLVDCSSHDGMLVAKSGARYRAIVLPPLDSIGSRLAEKLHGFASAGLPVFFAGETPSRGDGLLEDSKSVQSAMSSLRQLANAHFCADVASVISVLQKSIKPNIRFKGRAVSFIQKRIGRMNAFFLRNELDATLALEAEFEADGTPELWDPWTGNTASISYQRRSGDWAAVHLDLQPLSSALIVFDPDVKSAPANAVPAVRRVKGSQKIGVSGWKLTATGLLSGNSATIQRDLPELIDWSLNDDLRGFSGRGVYTTTFTAPASDRGQRFVLDLGAVRDVAEVVVNGKPMGTLLLRPYEADITGFVHEGENLLEVTVTNALFNCMVLREPRTFLAGPTENPSGLMSSGLIGPVQVKIMA